MRKRSESAREQEYSFILKIQDYFIISSEKLKYKNDHQ